MSRRSLNPLRYRNFATSGRLFAALGPALAAQRVDAVLACFGPSGEQAMALRDLGCFDAPVICSFHGVDAYGKRLLDLRPVPAGMQYKGLSAD